MFSQDEQNEDFNMPSQFHQVRRLLNTFKKWFIMTIILHYILNGSYIQDRVLEIIPNLH